MGRTIGFLSGVLFTSSVAYFTAQRFYAHQREVSAHLLKSKYLIDFVEAPKETKRIMTIEAEKRDSVVETSKDIWNDEIIQGVQKLYTINWEGALNALQDWVDVIVYWGQDKTK